MKIDEIVRNKTQAKISQTQEESLLENDAVEEQNDSDHNHSNSGSFNQL